LVGLSLEYLESYKNKDFSRQKFISCKDCGRNEITFEELAELKLEASV
jgi:4-hydroxy-3-methylbut-2-en-1-yl diphosphate synthase IspG/GcpE